MTMQFVKATKKRSKLRLAIDGPSGSGKTYTALTAAAAIAEGGKIAVIDTERGSASLYSDKFSFDVLELDTFNPQLYIDAIEAAERAGYSVIVIDSLSHAWEGEGGALDMVDRATQASAAKNSYYAWKNVTPLQRKLVDAMLQSKAHIIATMRSKTEYVEAEVTRNGRSSKEYRKVGTAPVQRAGIEYEFTIFVDMDLDHNLVVSKTRFDKWGDNKVEHKPSVKFFAELVDWLNSGAPETVEQPTVTTPASVAKVEEPAKQAETITVKVEPPTDNGKVTRPYTPDVLMVGLATKADKYRKAKNTYAQEGDRQHTAAALNQILGGDGQRKELLHYLTGKNSMSKTNPAYIGDAWVLALRDWLKPEYDPDAKAYGVDEHAVTEATAAHLEALKQNGQGVLLDVTA